MSQFFYVHPENPQKRLMKQAAEIVNNGGVIIFPTDSGYALGCALDDKRALERMCQIRKIDKKHNFTLVCKDLAEIAVYARVDNSAYRMLKNNTPGAYTFIFKSTKDLPKRLMNPSKRTIGIRIPDNAIALSLLEELETPLMTTSLILPGNISTEFDPEEIRDQLEHQVDLIINGGYLGESPTTVIDLSEDDVVIVREGTGDLSPFQ
ncbi:L-threonylcarbamoyladenylate synthase [Psychromonas sp. 14N.309.X.WAT.B.A12]|uniref:L-threonylcarbamoyladenylate synthase n=1 Tax=unclassified Psychromonas TaxID=2614957 RepID=UPI0025AEDF69|nr:L-threonylcarbamoyladenylate synthase [Psychromonas sp. 14N.309.X.WAT.B.A12]MDN2662454.1 L-threonylcarbamoyladenylate synthase [Psychromonas sp. 14N.309.X.WAT.B.A12]